MSTVNEFNRSAENVFTCCKKNVAENGLTAWLLYDFAYFIILLSLLYFNTLLCSNCSLECIFCIWFIQIKEISICLKKLTTTATIIFHLTPLPGY